MWLQSCPLLNCVKLIEKFEATMKQVSICPTQLGGTVLKATVHCCSIRRHTFIISKVMLSIYTLIACTAIKTYKNSLFWISKYLSIYLLQMIFINYLQISLQICIYFEIKYLFNCLFKILILPIHRIKFNLTWPSTCSMH